MENKKITIMSGRMRMAGLLSLMSSMTAAEHRIQIISPEEMPQEQKPVSKVSQTAPVSKGMKLFDINGITVYALNRKNAERKALKINDLKNHKNSEK